MHFVQMANTLTLLTWKVDAVARIIQTTFALALLLQKANELPISV